MINQTVDGINFKMQAYFDFSFLEKYGKVFKVFDDQNSGNICFGLVNGNNKFFVKFAGAPTLEYKGKTENAVLRLKSTVPIYQTVRQKSLIKYICSEEIGKGFVVIFKWSDGECMGRMYPQSHRRMMALKAEEKLNIFYDISVFLRDIAEQGYTAIDFYDGSIMYDAVMKKTTICDIDFFRANPAVNDMGQMWGSSRFMSPEEYELGAVLDEVTNVFTLGKMGFSLFTDSDSSFEAWPLSEENYRVLMKAVDPQRNNRYQSISEFMEHWNQALMK
jgi:serine/threonine-protein kinase